MSPKKRTERIAKVGVLATKHVVPLWRKHQRHCSSAPSQLYVLAGLHVVQDVWKMCSRVCNGIALGHSLSVHLFVHLARCSFSTLPNPRPEADRKSIMKRPIREPETCGAGRERQQQASPRREASGREIVARLSAVDEGSQAERAREYREWRVTIVRVAASAARCVT